MEKFAKANKVFYLRVSSWNVGRSFRAFSVKLNNFFSCAETLHKRVSFRLTLFSVRCRWKDFYSWDKFETDSMPKCTIFLLKLEATRVKRIRRNRIRCRIGHHRTRIYRHIFEIDSRIALSSLLHRPRTKVDAWTAEQIELQHVGSLCLPSPGISIELTRVNGHGTATFGIVSFSTLNVFSLLIFIANLCEFQVFSRAQYFPRFFFHYLMQIMCAREEEDTHALRIKSFANVFGFCAFVCCVPMLMDVLFSLNAAMRIHRVTTIHVHTGLYMFQKWNETMATNTM